MKKLLNVAILILTSLSAFSTQEYIPSNIRQNCLKSLLPLFGEMLAKEAEMFCFVTSATQTEYQQKMRICSESAQQINAEDSSFGSKQLLSFVSLRALENIKKAFREFNDKHEFLAGKEYTDGTQPTSEKKGNSAFLPCGKANPWEIYYGDDTNSYGDIMLNEVKISGVLIASETPELAYNCSQCYHDESSGFRVIQLTYVNNKFLMCLDENVMTNWKELSLPEGTIIVFSEESYIIPDNVEVAAPIFLAVKCTGECFHKVLLTPERYKAFYRSFCSPSVRPLMDLAEIAYSQAEPAAL